MSTQRIGLRAFASRLSTHPWAGLPQEFLDDLQAANEQPLPPEYVSYLHHCGDRYALLGRTLLGPALVIEPSGYLRIHADSLQVGEAQVPGDPDLFLRIRGETTGLVEWAMEPDHAPVARWQSYDHFGHAFVTVLFVAQGGVSRYVGDLDDPLSFAQDLATSLGRDAARSYDLDDRLIYYERDDGQALLRYNRRRPALELLIRGEHKPWLGVGAAARQRGLWQAPASS